MMPKKRTRPFPTRVACLLAASALSACGARQDAKAPAPAPQVTVVTVQRASVPVTVELPGRTSAYLVAQVRARVDGIVQKRIYEEGANVKANQPLYQIDPAQYQAQLNSAAASQLKAEANLASTHAQAERYRTLVAGNAVSKQAYDNAIAADQQAAADVAGARAAVAQARLNLGYTRVVAPISGRSSTSQVTQGAYVQASSATLLTTVQQIDPIYVDVNETSVADLQLRRDIAQGRLRPNGPGQAKITLTLEDGTQYPLPGRLEFADTTVDAGTGTVKLRAVFPNPKSVLLPGMFVRAHIEQGVDDDALLVPVRAVSHDPKGQATALVVAPDGKVQQRQLQTRDIQGEDWVVTGGLHAGERVVVAGLQKVQPGMQVQATEAPQQTAAAALASNQR